MTEQENSPASDQRIAEILGFDPESGERVEYRDALTPIKDSKLAVPEEIQNKFKELNGSYDFVVAVYPGKLLALERFEGEDSIEIHRNYFTIGSQDSGETEFWSTTLLSFSNEGGQLLPRHICYTGERSHGYCDSVIISFNHFETGDLLCRLDFDHKVFNIEYESGGKLNFIGFGPFTQGCLRSPEVLGLRDMMILRQSKRLEKKTSHGDFEAARHHEQLILNRFDDGNLMDVLFVPMNTDSGEIVEKLFSVWTLKDPIDAPPELDDSWRFANLMEVIGMKWERY